MLRTLSVSERLRKCGELATYIAVAESLQYPKLFDHEDIFSWSPSKLKDLLRGLLDKMSAQQRNEARVTLNPDEFDFASIVPVKKKAAVLGAVPVFVG